MIPGVVGSVLSDSGFIPRQTAFASRLSPASIVRAAARRLNGYSRRSGSEPMRLSRLSILFR